MTGIKFRAVGIEHPEDTAKRREKAQGESHSF